MDCKNAFGAGESRDASRGTTPLTSDGDGALVLSPIILGGVDNVVGQIWVGSGQAYSTPPPMESCGVTFYGYDCTTNHCNNYRIGANINAPSQYWGCDNTFFGIYNGNLTCGNTATNAYTSGTGPATLVRVAGGNLGIGSAPFDVSQLYFKDIPYSWYTYTRAKGNSHTNYCRWSGNDYDCDYYDATYIPTRSTGYVDGVIYINAGAHVRVAGNVSADGSSNSKATLDLPSGGAQYSLMIDGHLEENKINSQKNGVITNLATMAPKAVIGVHGNYVPGNGIATNAAGGTILIGPGTTGQNKMTIVASTSANGSAYSFSSLDNNCTSVYTGTWVPADGTANLGNYGDHDIKVDAAMKIAGTTAGTGTMAAGKMQIFNMKKSLTFDNFIPNIPSGATGNFLMLAANELKMSTSSTHTSNIAGSGSMTLMGAKVTLDKDETITLANNSSGSYNVIAYATRTDQYAIDHVGEAPGVAAFGPYGNTCSGGYGTCTSSAFDAEKITTPWPFIQSTQLAGISGTGYDANTCMPAFTHVIDGGGNINFNNATNSTVNVNGDGFARWQAFGSISTLPGKTLNWTVTNTAGANATASWIAGGNIGLGTGNTTNWSTASTHAGRRIFWDAGLDINTNDLIAQWSTTGEGDMYWRARGTINAGNTTNRLNKVEWTSSNKGSMRWEGYNINVANGGNDLKFTQSGSAGTTYWGAENSITVDLGSANVLFTNSSTAPNGAGTMMWITNGGDIITKGTNGKKVAFVQTNATAGTSAWKAGYRQDGPPHHTTHRGSIRTNNVIEFKNAANNPYDMIWQACNSILTNHNATTGDSNDHNMVTFENNGKGNMIWHAADSIVTRSKTNFHNTSSAEGNMTWYAGNHIKTRLGTADNTDDLQKGIIFKQEGKGRTTWWAETGNIETYNPVHFDWTTTTDDATSILW